MDQQERRAGCKVAGSQGSPREEVKYPLCGCEIRLAWVKYFPAENVEVLLFNLYGSMKLMPR